MSKITILCAAIWFDDGVLHMHQPKNINAGFVVAGRRHHNCFATLAALKVSHKDGFLSREVQGFITSDDRFVGRQEAMAVAVNSGQYKGKEKEILFSEDIY